MKLLKQFNLFRWVLVIVFIGMPCFVFLAFLYLLSVVLDVLNELFEKLDKFFQDKLARLICVGIKWSKKGARDE